MRFIEKLNARWRSSRSLLCVGLDPDLTRLPANLNARPDGIEQFCREIIDATADFACAFKPQIAYFAAASAEAQLEAVIAYLRDNYPDIPVVLDAKRGDIGSTAKQYAREAFDRYGADAVTVNPYMGTDSITPYLEWTEKAVFVLCRTSNAGGDDFQSLPVGQPASDKIKLYEKVASMANASWNDQDQVGLVVGATYPEELARVRQLAPAMPLLVPGIGAQGGDIDATVAAGVDANGFGMLINSSRAIIYAGSGADFAQSAGMAAQATCDAIERARSRFAHQS
ncbi:MAG: orotidine-5'-phosphate decarboxylase [Burkholderiaceae bacterium]